VSFNTHKIKRNSHVRSESTGVVDLVVLDFNISGVGGVEELQLEDLRVVKS
jgi:hypothetical protein